MAIGGGTSGGGGSQGGAKAVRAVAYTADPVPYVAQSNVALALDSWRTDLGQEWTFDGNGAVILPEDGVYFATWHQYISGIVVPLAGLSCDLSINGTLTPAAESYPGLDEFYVSPLTTSVEHVVTSPIFLAEAGDIVFPQIQFDTPTDFTVSGPPYQKLYIQKVA